MYASGIFKKIFKAKIIILKVFKNIQPLTVTNNVKLIGSI